MGKEVKMSKKNIYRDPSLLADKEDGVKIKKDDTPHQKTLKDIWKEFCDQLLTPRNLITFMTLFFIFYSAVIYKEVIDIPRSIKFIPYLLLLGAILSSYKSGKPNWSRITVWFIVGVIAVFVYGTFNDLEKTRSGNKQENIGQKVYNGLASYFTEEEAEAKISPTSRPSRSNQTLGVGEHPFVLSKGEQTHWLQIPGNMIYDVYLPKGEGGFALYYSDGTIVEFKEGENKELPRKTLATFRITARGERQHFTVTVKNRKIS